MFPSSQSWSTSRPSAPRGSLVDQAPANTSRRGSLANVVVTNSHATPPRSNGPRHLPTSSPSSDRLRRIAPTPLQLAPRPRLVYAPVPLGPSVPRRRPGTLRPASFDLRAVDDVTLPPRSLEGEVDQWSQSIQQYLASRAEHGSRTSDSSSTMAVPMLLDLDGRHSHRMQGTRPVSATPDDVLPEELQEPESSRIEPHSRNGAGRSTPARRLRANYIPEVLVNFDTDVFSPRFDRAPVVANDTRDPHDRTPSPNDNVVSMRNASVDSSYSRTGSSTSSFYAPERRDTDLSAYRFPAAGQTTLPVHEETYHALSTPSRYSLETHQLEQALVPYRIDSSDTIFSEVITPTHVATPLPPQSPETRAYAPPKHLRFAGQESTQVDEEPMESNGPQRKSSCASIDSDHERAIEDAGGTPGRGKPKTKKIDRPPPVPAIPLSYMKAPTMHVTPSIIDFVASEQEAPLEDSETKATVVDPVYEDHSWPPDLRKFDRETFVEIHVDQTDGPSYCVKMPFRRLTKPDFWQTKEDEALILSSRLGRDPPRIQPFQQTGAIVFGQHSRGRDSWYLDHPQWCAAPVLHAITANEDYTKSLTDHVELDIREPGIHHAYGHDEYGEVEWMFEYLVKDQHVTFATPDDELLRHGRYVFPMFLYATTSFLKGSHAEPREDMVYAKKGFSERLAPPTFSPRPVLAPVVWPGPSVPIGTMKAAVSTESKNSSPERFLVQRISPKHSPSKRSPLQIPLLRVSSEPVSLVASAMPEPGDEAQLDDGLAVIAPSINRSQSDGVVSHSDSSGPIIEEERENVPSRTLVVIGRVLGRQRPNTPASAEMKFGALQAAQSTHIPKPLSPEPQTPAKTHGGIRGLFKLGSKSKSGSRPGSARAHSPLSSVISVNDLRPDDMAAPTRAESPAPSQAPTTSGTSFLQRFSGKSRSTSRPSSSRGPSSASYVLDESNDPSNSNLDLSQRADATNPSSEEPEPEPVKRTRSNSLLAKLVRPFTPPHVFMPDKDSPPVPPLPKNAQHSSPTPLRSLKGMKSLSSLNPNVPFTKKVKPVKPPPVPKLPTLPQSATAAVFPRDRIILAQDTPEIRRMHPFLTELKPLPPPIPGSTWTHLNPQPTHVLVPVKPFSTSTPQAGPSRPKRTLVPRSAYTSETRPTSAPSHLRPIMPRAPEEAARPQHSLRPPPRKKPIPLRRPSTTDTDP